MQQNKATVNLNEDAVYIVKDDDVYMIELPQHGEVVIKSVNGKAQKYDVRESCLLKK